MGLAPGGATPPGAISHWVARRTGNPSRRRLGDAEAYDKFAAEKIGQYSAEARVTDEPEMRVYEVHNHLTKT